ncbi:major facilitator superfamily domain-containing protein [Lasiosphaeria miniovina]|uniref:Major facilitator superfamily domain-containing protein n=1 Tax=Lasiosphaeria miniovina TaxID=1954250 RepID=A0AA40DZ49_9PEZI|nr:major facilitator superfamily domain-containing protein [Lasiosphaeria miniovina]KAK0721894.1 major facilitator superfamily domain-containing protein [Lasiosphaeria miniovina]
MANGGSIPGISRLGQSAPLLGCRPGDAAYATSPEPLVQAGRWKPSPRFWWIETALWANVFLSGFDGTITASTYAAISSDFDAANNASWLTTSYLITSTASQPLYGRFSDVFGRRVCFFISTITFILGCFGCSVAQSMTQLNVARAAAGFGGGGLITMACLGGVIVDGIGWRWCFLSQVPISIFALVVGYCILSGSEHATGHQLRVVLGRLDFAGALILVGALVTQLLGLSLGGNDYPWNSEVVIGALALSVLLLAAYLLVEAKTEAMPIIPLHMLHGWQPAAVQLTNVFVGMSSYAYMFMVPLFFQAVRGDSPSAAGMRLMIPSMATLGGGILAGLMMQQGFQLRYNVRKETALMLVGNILACIMGTAGNRWTEMAYLVPANLGVGLTNPSVLFSFVSLFEYREQAVATSTVYLIRSMGSIFMALPQTLGPDASDEVTSPPFLAVLSRQEAKEIHISLRELPPATEIAVRALYGDILRIAFVASSGCALLAFVFSWAHRTEAMSRKN